MKRKKYSIFSLTLVFFLFCQCAANNQVVHTSLRLPERKISFDSNSKYQFVASNGFKTDSLSGQQLRFDDDKNAVIFPDQKVFQYDQIQFVIEKKKNGRNTLKGLGMGAVGGLVVGSVILGIGLADDGSGCADRGECDALSGFAGIVGFGVSLAMGALLGLGIGALTPRYQTTTYQFHR